MARFSPHAKRFSKRVGVLLREIPTPDRASMNVRAYVRQCDADMERAVIQAVGEMGLPAEFAHWKPIIDRLNGQNE